MFTTTRESDRTITLMQKLLFVVALVASVGRAAETRYDRITAELRSLEAQASHVARVVSIGNNDDGVPILALRVSLQPELSNPLKIAHLIVGTHHGNEVAAATTAMAFARALVAKFQSASVFRDGLVETEWLVIPVLNISGYNRGTRHERGIDPNRDYPSPCVADPGGRLKSTTLLRRLFDARTWVGTITVHGYIGTLTFPWGVNVSDTRTHDHNAFERVTAKAARVNGYRYGTSTEIVYPADGTYEDWAYWRHGTWSLLVELRDGSPSDIARTVDAMFTWFDELDRAPSTLHSLEAECKRAGALDLGIE